MKPNKLPTYERVNEIFIYDPSTGLVTRKIDSNNQVKKGDDVGGGHRSGYLIAQVDRKPYYLHRIIYLMVSGNDPYPMQVDHIDGNRKNNRFENLRLVTNSGNRRNLGSVGVSYFKNNKKWAARIKTQEGRIFLGLFTSFDEAMETRRLAEIKYWGKEANLRRSAC